MRKSIWIVLIVASPLLAQENNGISAARIREHTRFLASDLLEGRGVGERGGDLATEYIATEFALAGLKPAGDNGTFFQRVPLIGAAVQPAAKLSASGNGKEVSFRWEDDFVGAAEQQKTNTTLDAEA